MREDVKGWMGFVILLMVRGVVLTLAGWFVGYIVGRTWHINSLLGGVLGLFLVLGMGLLYIVMEWWP